MADPIGDDGWYRVGIINDEVPDSGGATVIFYCDYEDDGGSTYVFGANLTETPVLYEYIPSFGTPVWTSARTLTWESMPDKFKDILSDAVGSSSSEGTLVAQITPGYSIDGVDDDSGLITVRYNTGISLLYHGLTGFTTYDGTTVSETSSVTSTDPIVVAVYWSKARSKMNIGFKETGESWTWAGEDAYDDAFQITGAIPDLTVGYDNPYPFNIKRLYFYQRALSTDAIEQNF